MSEARISGTVHVIEATKNYGQKGFRKRLVVLEQDNGRFVNYIPLEFTNEGCDSVNELKVGDEAEITYRLTGRKWQKDAGSEVKFFLNAEATGFKVLKQKAESKSTVAADEYGEPPDDSETPF